MQKTFTDIPLNRPATPLLDAVNAPEDLRKLDPILLAIALKASSMVPQ